MIGLRRSGRVDESGSRKWGIAALAGFQPVKLFALGAVVGWLLTEIDAAEHDWAFDPS
jgi:hypothetical protein